MYLYAEDQLQYPGKAFWNAFYDNLHTDQPPLPFTKTKIPENRQHQHFYYGEYVQRAQKPEQDAQTEGKYAQPHSL